MKKKSKGNAVEKFVRSRLEGARKLANALADTSRVLADGMAHTADLIEDYERRLAKSQAILNEVGERLFRLADKGDSRETKKATVLAELEDIRSWLRGFETANEPG